jgi:hypothetical protein
MASICSSSVALGYGHSRDLHNCQGQCYNWGLRLQRPSEERKQTQVRRSTTLRLLAALVAGGILIAQGSSDGWSRSAESGSVVVTVFGPGTVVSIPAGTINCPPSCTGSRDLESTFTLEERVPTGNHFVEWGDSCAGSAPRCTIAIDDSNPVRASFAPGFPPRPPTAIPLNITRSGDGAVSSEPAGVIDCGTLCGTAFSGGATIQITPVPGSGSVFVGWGGSCAGTATCSLPMVTERNVTAPFRPQIIPPGSSTITVENPRHPGPGFNIFGVGDVVVTSPAGARRCTSTSCSYSFVNGTSLTIDGVDGQFRSWTGLCVGEFSRCSLVVTQSGSVTVRWFAGLPVTNEFGLNVTRAGVGRVSSNPPGIDCGTGNGCVAAYKPGTNVTLSATPNSGYAFAEWSGDCSGTGSCRVPMDAARWVAAVFRKKRDLVRVVKSGAGAGSVESEPGGISCGSDCEERFVEGTQLTLRAIPDATSRLAAWQGPCSGTGICRFAVTADADVGARFAVCAARVVSGFNASVKMRPRRVVARVQLAGAASARVRLRHAGKIVAAKRFSGLSVGTHKLSVGVPTGAPGGQYRAALRVADLCGSSRTMTQKVRLPRP